MEFYQYLYVSDSISKTFQFPTGWNSTLLLLAFACDLRRFQFPTGWNSTKNAHTVNRKFYVSIPNGMEFY